MASTYSFPAAVSSSSTTSEVNNQTSIINNRATATQCRSANGGLVVRVQAPEEFVASPASCNAINSSTTCTDVCRMYCDGCSQFHPASSMTPPGFSKSGASQICRACDAFYLAYLENRTVLDTSTSTEPIYCDHLTASPVSYLLPASPPSSPEQRHYPESPCDYDQVNDFLDAYYDTPVPDSPASAALSISSEGLYHTTQRDSLIFLNGTTESPDRYFTIDQSPRTPSAASEEVVAMASEPYLESDFPYLPFGFDDPAYARCEIPSYEGMVARTNREAKFQRAVKLNQECGLDELHQMHLGLGLWFK